MTQASGDLRRVDELQLVLGHLQAQLADADAEPAARLASCAQLTAFVKDARDSSSGLNADAHLQQIGRNARKLGDLLAATAEQDGVVERLAASLPMLWQALRESSTRRLTACSEALLGQYGRASIEAGAFFLALFALALIHVYVQANLLSRPVKRLAATARQVAEGDLAARAKTDSDGAVDELAEDFNEMVDILVESLYQEERAAEELRRRTADLEEANRHKSRFLANVSHELKTPLSTIIGFADILASGQHGAVTPRQSDYLGRIFTAGNHLLGMISDLIDMAKLDLDALALEPAEVAAEQLVQEVVDMLAEEAAAKNLTISFAKPEKTLVAAIDRRRAKQILVNLLANAVKFTPDGGQIALACEGGAADLVITVADSGIGVPPAEQERVFEDFVQLDSEMHRRHGGAGIGLPLSRRLARKMGGDLELLDPTDQGSMFRLRLPRTGEPENG